MAFKTFRRYGPALWVRRDRQGHQESGPQGRRLWRAAHRCGDEPRALPRERATLRHEGHLEDFGGGVPPVDHGLHRALTAARVRRHARRTVHLHAAVYPPRPHLQLLLRRHRLDRLLHLRNRPALHHLRPPRNPHPRHHGHLRHPIPRLRLPPHPRPRPLTHSPPARHLRRPDRRLPRRRRRLRRPRVGAHHGQTLPAEPRDLRVLGVRDGVWGDAVGDPGRGGDRRCGGAREGYRARVEELVGVKGAEREARVAPGLRTARSALPKCNLKGPTVGYVLKEA
mmetsp:Transcript_18115/g.48173  ORF Transcript_18115/g.48173 Transcript_18115/m.48173 type:complete len:282 (-) Transcript_18115:565-1410(-)